MKPQPVFTSTQAEVAEGMALGDTAWEETLLYGLQPNPASKSQGEECQGWPTGTKRLSSREHMEVAEKGTWL